MVVGTPIQIATVPYTLIQVATRGKCLIFLEGCGLSVLLSISCKMFSLIFKTSCFNNYFGDFIKPMVLRDWLRNCHVSCLQTAPAVEKLGTDPSIWEQNWNDRRFH